MLEKVKAFWRQSQARAWAKIQAVFVTLSVAAPHIEGLFTDANTQPHIQKLLGEWFGPVLIGLAVLTFLCAPHGDEHS